MLIDRQEYQYVFILIKWRKKTLDQGKATDSPT